MAARKRPILKKRTAQEQKEDLESLFVFGYECKVFKDDEKADYIERGKHLIPWMGDNSLMIDRYDGRGYLHDLRPYDADLNSHKNVELTGEELAVEAACEEERYLELNTDYMERVLYEEEELKRLHEALGEDSYGAVGFSYDQGVGQQNDQDNSDSEKDEEFIPPRDLHVPEGIKLPDTVKMNAIVVKTAKCISEHGTQMEIIIKTKQADNPQFHFLEYDSELYPYYRHLVQIIKSGRYNPSSMLKPRRSRQESVTEEEGHYLHPSLVKTSSSSEFSSQDILSIISHRLPVSQISDTPYARLVEKMKQSGCRSPLNTTQPKSHAAPEGDGVPPLDPPPVPPFAANADSEPVKNHGRLPPVPGVEPVILPPRSQPPPQPADTLHEHTHTHSRDTEEDNDRPPIEPPPPDQQPIIDKMATYVAKNGPEFEIVVKSKKDKRFDFLHSWHKHFPYYDHKKTLHLQELKRAASSSDDDDNDSSSNDRSQLKSISFSIRMKEMDSVSLGGRAALLGYDSSSEDDSSGEKDEGGDGACAGTVVIPEHVTVTKDKTPPSTEEQEKKLVEQRLRDKLAAAARDKLAHAAKEKQLQAERKRKAAMFISMLKGGTAAAQLNSESQPPGSTLPTSASAPTMSTMSLEGLPSSTHSNKSPAGSPPNYRRSPDLFRFPRRSRSPINHHRSRHKRHWSPPKRRSRSPMKRARGKTPPSAYSVARRSLSKSPRRRRKSRSRSPQRPKRPKRPHPLSPSLAPRISSPSLSRAKSKGKKRSRSSSKSKMRSRSKSKSRQRSTSQRRSRSKSKGHSMSRAKESSLSKTSPSRVKSQKDRSRSRSRSKVKRSRKSPSRSKKHKKLRSRSPSRRKRSHSRSPSKHKSKKHSKSKKKSPSKHKSKSRSKRSPSISKRSRSKKMSSSPSSVPSRPTSKQPSRSRSNSVDDATDSKTESKRSPSVSKTLPVDVGLHSENGNQDLKKADCESEPVKSLARSTSSNDDSPMPKEHKETLSWEATDDDASNDSDVIITGEETAPQRDPVANPSSLRGVDSPLGAEKPVSEDLLMKVRAMLRASRQEIDTT